MSTTELDLKDEVELVRHGDALAAEVNALVVKDDETYQHAAGLAKDLASWIKKGETWFAPLKQSAHRTWKAVCDRENEVLGPKKGLKDMLAGKMTAFVTERERERQEAERQARAEQDRLELEAMERSQAETARLFAEEEDRRLAQAAEAEARGDTQTAERIIAERIIVPLVVPEVVFAPPTVLPSTPKVEGVSYRSDYSAKLVDLKALVKAAAEGNSVAFGLLAFDQVKANGVARALKKALAVPGVEVVERKVQVTKVP